jgi:carbamoyltransferase
MKSQYQPTHARLGALSYHLTLPLFRALGAAVKFYSPLSTYARERAKSMQTKLERGGTVYLLGIRPAGHNAGVALVEVSREQGIRLLCNNEEEHFTGIKHCADFPKLAIEELLKSPLIRRSMLAVPLCRLRNRRCKHSSARKAWMVS